MTGRSGRAPNVTSQFGFRNRWNNILAAPLEEKPVAVDEEIPAGHGWSAGKHLRQTFANPVRINRG